jgi:membrane protein
MWPLGGLPVRELLQRTARESWQDDVFGQAARLAFYHFIAIFPVLLLILMALARLAGTGNDMRQMLTQSLTRVLPPPAALLVSGAIQDLNASAHAGVFLLVATGSSLWAGFNASWAMIVGLNTAYETAEDRTWWNIAKAAAGLALAVLVLVFAALLTAHYADGTFELATPSAILRKLAAWGGIAGILLISFELFYRFGPNLERRDWQSSLPGAVAGAALWVVSTLVVREYFAHFSSYERIYGRAAAAAMLLMWLYMTGATVLIGAELNSEIEKARESDDGEKPVRHSRTPAEPR